MARCDLVAAAALGALLAGCGSQDPADLPAPPAPATPAALRATADDGRLRAALDPQARTLAVTDTATGRTTTLPAGAGPTAVVSEADRFYVVDAVGEGLLVVQTAPEPRVTRRVALLGRPSAAAVHPDRHEVYVALRDRDEVVQLPAHGRPFVRRRFATVDAPRAVQTGRRASGGVLVRGRGTTQVLAPADLDREQDG